MEIRIPTSKSQGAGAQLFVQKPAEKRQRDQRHGDGVAELPGEAEGGELFVSIFRFISLNSVSTTLTESSA